MPIDVRRLCAAVEDEEDFFDRESRLAHFDASDTSRITHSGGSVSAAETQGGLSLTKQDTGTIRTNNLKQNGLNVVEGLPSAPSDYPFLQSATNVDFDLPLTLFAVVQSLATSGFNWVMGSSPGDWWQIGFDHDSGRIRFRTGIPTQANANYMMSGAENEWHIIVAHLETDGTMSIWVDDVAGTTSSLAGGWTADDGLVRFLAGRTTGNQTLHGPLAEAGTFNEILDRSEVYTQLNNKWKIFGQELLRSGGFDDDSEWATVGDFSVSGSAASKAAQTALSTVSQTGVAFEENAKYLVSLDIASLSNSDLIVSVAGTAGSAIPAGTTGLVHRVIETPGTLITPGLFLISQELLGLSSILSVSVRKVL